MLKTPDSISNAPKVCLRLISFYYYHEQFAATEIPNSKMADTDDFLGILT